VRSEGSPAPTAPSATSYRFDPWRGDVQDRPRVWLLGMLLALPLLGLVLLLAVPSVDVMWSTIRRTSCSSSRSR
jgi:hypothetical protein